MVISTKSIFSPTDVLLVIQDTHDEGGYVSLFRITTEMRGTIQLSIDISSFY